MIIKNVRSIIYFISIGFLLYGCASSTIQLNRGAKSYKTHHYRQAFVRLLPTAKAGSPAAQYAIAYMYFYGQGVVEDKQKAFYWMQQSAAQGYTKAQTALSLLKRQKPSAYRPSNNPKKRPL